MSCCFKGMRGARQHDCGCDRMLTFFLTYRLLM